jgi:hypothetical protein
MKQSHFLIGAIAVVVGCSKDLSGEGQGSGNTSSRELKPFAQTGNSPPSVTPPKSNPVPSAPKPNGESVTSITSRQLPVQTQPMRSNIPPHLNPEPPKENPAAAPPKPGETVANNFRIEMGNRAVEVEGVCKLTEDETVCWRPDGAKNEALATELTNAIRSKNDSYSNTFQFKFMKKNRILVLKSTVKPTKPGEMYSQSYGLMNDSMMGMPDHEGWTNGNGAFSGSNGAGFDQVQTERQVLTGAFAKTTKTFPLRYQFTSSSQERKVIPFAKGQFSIEGNTYEIISISDKPDASDPRINTYGMGRTPGGPVQKFCYLKIKTVKISNPNTMLSLTPADESGSPYAAMNEKGDPISSEEQRKKMEEANKKMMDAQRAGKPYDYNGMSRNGMNGYVQSITLDPSYNFGPSQTPMVMPTMFNIEASKIKKIAINVSKRSVFVFDKIKLDGG